MRNSTVANFSFVTQNFNICKLSLKIMTSWIMSFSLQVVKHIFKHFTASDPHI